MKAMQERFAFEKNSRLRRARQQAWQRYASTFAVEPLLPPRQQPSKIDPESIEKALDSIFQEGRPEAYICFVNGICYAKPSQGVEVRSLGEALASHGALLEKGWIAETRAAPLLNLAIHEQGYLLFFSTTLATKVHIVELFFDAVDPLYSRLQIFVAPEVRVHLHIHRIKLTTDAIKICSVFQWFLGTKSEVYCAEEERGWELTDAFENYNLFLQQAHSLWRSRAISLQGMHSNLAFLDGEGASYDYAAIQWLFANARSAIRQQVFHRGAQTHSVQRVRSLVGADSHASFETHVSIEKSGLHAFVRQEHKTLLLSASATVHSEPILCVAQPDVQATHGSTVCDLDPELLFYLQARGISRSEARALIVVGFSLEPFDAALHIDDAPLVAWLQKEIYSACR